MVKAKPYCRIRHKKETNKRGTKRTSAQSLSIKNETIAIHFLSWNNGASGVLFP